MTHGAVGVRRIPVAASLLLALACLPGLGPGLRAQPVGRWHDVSLDDYRKHLAELSTLTSACAKARDLKTCDPLLIGPDDRVPLANQRRLVRYGWLRLLFARALEPDGADDPKKLAVQSASDDVKPATIPQLLKDAQARLAADLAQASEPPATLPADEQQHAVLQQVLAGREFRNLKTPDVRDTVLERIANWLNRIFAGLGKMRTHSAWLGWVLTYGFLAAVSTALIVLLLRMERRWRVRLVPELPAPAPGAASARDWQLWLADASKAAAAGEWREAVHFLYWAAIARLESRRMWPADRARTPREYLALVAGDDPRRLPLAALTRDFERIWYGGRPAAERDYRRADELASELTGSGPQFLVTRGGGRAPGGEL